MQRLKRHVRRSVTLPAMLLAACLAGMAASVIPPSAAATGPNGAGGQGCPEHELSGAQWYYNWDVSMDCALAGYVPMITGRKKGAGDIQWSVDRAMEKNPAEILGFNEPDEPGQSPMTVDEAIALWPILVKSGAKLASPAPTSSSRGRDWLAAFMAEADRRNLRVDILAVHWYGWNRGSCTVGAFADYLRWAKSIAGGRPIWVTEFGCLNQSVLDEPGTVAFYKEAVATMRAEGIARWAWYIPQPGQELVRDGRLTTLGEAFLAESGGKRRSTPEPPKNADQPRPPCDTGSGRFALGPDGVCYPVVGALGTKLVDGGPDSWGRAWTACTTDPTFGRQVKSVKKFRTVDPGKDEYFCSSAERP